MLLLATPFAMAQGGAARLSSAAAQPDQCLSALDSVVIDGRSMAPDQPVPEWSVEVLPGVHRVSGVVRLDTSRCKSARGDAGVRVPPLEALFEAGKTYRIGFDHSAIDASDWRLVLLEEPATPMMAVPPETGAAERDTAEPGSDVQ